MYVDASSEAYANLVEGHDGLCQWAQPLRRMERDLVGRDREIRSLMATFSRAELTNVILLGPAGVGKTSIVQGAMMRDSGRIYLEVDTARMLEGLANEDELGTRLSRLFDEVEAVQRAGHHEIVLFIDEFHKIIQKSSAATEDLKPLLAASGTRGIRVVAATTYDEFRQWVAPNQALVERLQRLNVAEADHDMTLTILTDMCGRYHVRATPEVLEQIYTVTERYVPANAQPRKSILVLDAMIGWHRAENRPLDRRLLNDVLLEQEGVELAADVDPHKIKAELDRVVYAQDFATLALERRLQLCLAELNDQDKPQATMLFCGATGSGKTALAKAAADIVNVSFIRFDMTEFSQPSSVERFRVELSNAVWAHPRAVVLLDEIEKACGEVTRMLLPVLDDARIVDANGREVTFKNAYVIMTTNAGSEIFKHMAQYSESDTGNEQALKSYEAQIRRSISETSSQNQFPPELLGRIDTIVPFQPLSRNTMRRIVVRELVNLRRRLAKVYDVGFEVSPRLADFIVNDELTTESDEGGARRALHIVERDITTEVSRVVTAPNCPRTLYAWVSGRLKSEEKTRLVSDARVRVGTVQEYFADAQAVRDDDAAGRPRTILPAMR